MSRENKKDPSAIDAEEQPLKEEPKNGVQNMTWWEKFMFMKSNINVEPVIAFFVWPSVLTLMAAQNLNIEKACRVNLEFDDSVCTNLKLRHRENLTSQEDEVQKLIASVQAWRSVILASVPTAMSVRAVRYDPGVSEPQNTYIRNAVI